ncbi:MAG TPA: hypothetical protein VK348_07495, partial [Planctomycetota bacterium]|nr:hypothetical protein [Planctomycetota bacterium]
MAPGLVAVGLAVAAFAQDQRPAATPPAAVPPATVRTVDGRSFAGHVTVDEQGTVRVATPGGDQTLQFADLESIDLSAAVAARKPIQGHTVRLRSGQELLARALGGTAAAGDQPALLRLTTAFAGDVDLP